ncbi:MAG: hypothetical protein KF683_11930 [Rubrivivax sp.]|nr:hypothetical protein [Rubrivivax sp.]
MNTLRLIAVALLLPLLAALHAGEARAQSSEQLKTDFARAVYLNSATRVHEERPQPLLRAVVVLRVRLGDDDRWQAEVFRDNPEQPEMTRVALESVARLPPAVGLTREARQALRSEGLIEAWLFQSDGRFALKTLAKPQRSA